MLSDRDFSVLLAHMNRPWSGFRKVRKGVKKRIRRHMAEIECSSIEQYLVALSDPQIRASCEHHLRVTISRFFRDRELWQALQVRILPDLGLEFSPPLRIWSAGCACGEEAYSLAMLCQASTPPISPVLVASDALPECLRRAREGVYNRSSLREVPDEIQKRFVDFGRKGRQATIRKHVLPPVRWQLHDLTGEPVDKRPFHLILLRNNLLTYYQGRPLEAAFSRIISTLMPGGCLVIGSHERLPRTTYPLVRDEGCPWVYWHEKGT